MLNLVFNTDNNNKYTLGHQEEVSCTYHINTFDYPIMHSHKDYWEFTVLTNGSIINFINNAYEIYEDNTLFFSTTNDQHMLMKNKDCKEKLRYFNIIVREDKLKNICESISPSFFEWLKNTKRNFHFSKSLTIRCESIIHSLRLLKAGDYEKYNEYLISILMLILHHLLGIKLQNSSSDESWIGVLKDLENSQDFLQYNVNTLCDAMEYSRMQLTRLMKNEFNVTPHEYLENYKLNYAENLLITSDMSIDSIRNQIGYCSLSVFINNFKKKFGLTPLQYRKHKFSLVKSFSK